MDGGMGPEGSRSAVAGYSVVAGVTVSALQKAPERPRGTIHILVQQKADCCLLVERPTM